MEDAQFVRRKPGLLLRELNKMIVSREIAPDILCVSFGFNNERIAVFKFTLSNVEASELPEVIADLTRMKMSAKGYSFEIDYGDPFTEMVYALGKVSNV